MGKYATRLEGESQKDYERRYNAEKIRQRREKIKAGLLPPPQKIGKVVSKYAIRQEGESDEDFRRRYERTKRQALRAKEYAERTEPPKKRGKNKAPAKSGNLTVEQWESLKIRDGETSEEHKRRYSREIMRMYRSRLTDEKREEELEKARLRDLEYRTSGNGKLIRKQWYQQNTAKVNFYAANRRAAEIRATPLWIDYEEIAKIYDLAAELTKTTGIQYHVDHHYPLRGRTVSGLHVHTNLDVIPARDNLRKLNKHPDNLHF
jgi:hypothetical protein